MVPALFWGILPIWIRKFAGGNFRSQLLGTTIGIVILAVVLQGLNQFQFSTETGWLFFLSGFCWSFGQCGQYYGFEHLGVSTTMPLSTALQIIGNSFIGGLFFAEWQGRLDVFLSLIALVVIVLGVFLINGKLRFDQGEPRHYVVLILTTIGYWGYSALPQLAHVSSNLTGFLPQSLGMLVAALLIGFTKRKDVLQVSTVKNISSGLLFSVAAAVYLISLSLNGLVNAFILSQINVVVATLLGGILLKELKAGQLKWTVIGLVVLLGGATFMVMI